MRTFTWPPARTETWPLTATAVPFTNQQRDPHPHICLILLSRSAECRYLKYPTPAAQEHVDVLHHRLN
jgi:hypothetical protein